MDRLLTGRKSSLAKNRELLLDDIVAQFDALAAKLQQSIELLSKDDSGTVELSALHRAKEAAESGASTSREATHPVRRAFPR